MTKAPVLLAWVAGMFFIPPAIAQDPEPKPAIRIRLAHPDDQLKQVLSLFKGTKAADPAAALAAWKRAAPEPNKLGKPLEALIAAFNPRMVAELNSLEGAEVAIRFDSRTGEPTWSAILPQDDGTFAALATAFVLSGGASQPPLGEFAVDRLAGPGSPLMAKVPGGTLLASDREGLKLAQRRLGAPLDKGEVFPNRQGIVVVVEPGSLAGSNSLGVRRFDAMLRPADQKVREVRDLFGGVQSQIELDRGFLQATVIYTDARPFPKVTTDPAWFDWTPNDRAIASFAIATDPAQPTWNNLFAMADRIEKIDPARANVVSAQVRLDLLARIAGLGLESDLLPHLLGVSGWVGSGDSRTIDNAFLAFHLDDPTAAERIVKSVKPLPEGGSKPPGELDRPRWLGQIEGGPLRITRSEQTVIITWGDGVLEASRQARDQPDRSSGPQLRPIMNIYDKSLVSAFFWPEKLPSLGLARLPRVKSDREPLPIHGFVSAANSLNLTISLGWAGINETLRRFLETLPLNPPPDH